jgi:hypothetical protein|tara:strand:- start:1551 stop:1706 length:156 start_codon:yes stop_codon:yes gene_type:complete
MNKTVNEYTYVLSKENADKLKSGKYRTSCVIGNELQVELKPRFRQKNQKKS